MNDLALFSKFGFKVEYEDPKRIMLFSQGKDFGVYLEILPDVFSVECVHNPFSNKIFHWQHYSSFEEIAWLIVHNHILSEQICESSNLAVHT